ncbi:MAG TPA: O-antigen ligase family protein [Chryseosolibacter sp.]
MKFVQLKLFALDPSNRSLALKYLFIGTAATLPLTTTINGILSFSLIACWLASMILSRPNLKNVLTPFNMTMTFFFIVHVLGLIYTENMRVGLQHLERMYSYVIFPILFGSVAISEKTVRLAFLSFSVAALLCSALYIFFDELWLDEILTTNRTYRGLYLVISVAILTNYLFTDTISKAMATLCLTGIFSAIFLLAHTGAKMPIILTPLLLLIFLFTYFLKTGKIVLPLILAIAAVISISVFVANNSFTKSRLMRLYTERFDYIRYRNWQTNLDVINKNLILGVGTGDSLDELQRARETWWQEYIDKYNSHNQYLETTLAVGLPGLITLLLIFGILCYNGFRRADFLLIAFSVVMVIGCVTESLLQRQKGIIVLTFLIAGFVNTKRLGKMYQKSQSAADF